MTFRVLSHTDVPEEDVERLVEQAVEDREIKDGQVLMVSGNERYCSLWVLINDAFSIDAKVCRERVWTV